MNLWADAFDSMNELDQLKDLTVDQQIQIAQIKALLSISQELSTIHHQGISPEYDAG